MASLESDKFSWDSLASAATNQALLEGARIATNNPMVLLNRARAAAAIQLGYEQMDLYERWRPTLFAASASGAAISLAMLYRRRRNPEAVTLYTIIAAMSSAMAYFTRPMALRADPAPMPPTPPGVEPPPSAMAEYLGMLDKRAGRMDAERPGWQPQTWQRLANDLGWTTIPAPVEVALTRGA